MRFSLVGAAARDWAALLRAIDARGLVLSRRETNQVLDQLAVALDAEREARASKFETAADMRPIRRRKR